MRRLARLGSAYGPEWFVRVAPPAIGVAVCLVASDRRRAIARNLRRLRPSRGAIGDAADVGRTFAAYASCLAEILRAGSPRARLPEAVVWGDRHFEDALEDRRGLIIATAHTGGWEIVGPLLSRDRGLKIMIAEAPEADATARTIQDGARRAQGLLVTHVGDDPLATLTLARHLRGNGAVALQIDRLPPGMRTRAVVAFGEPSRIPEGPLRLAALTGAPIVAAFASRTGHRRYEVVAAPPIRVARGAADREIDIAAQRLADSMEAFVRAHPTQWFHFV
ncbi:MAG TPA: lysophospholipid acyltransferase family protein [Polyangiaceae bacterium]|nr:lysophospholipid acyltransferase family protein [Polyangiaceae bacterium]